MKAGEVDETEEVFDVVFLSSDESPEVVHPCEEPLHFPASAVAAQLAGILTPGPVAPIGRDHLNAVFLVERAVERVRVVGLVADEPLGELVRLFVWRNKSETYRLPENSGTELGAELGDWAFTSFRRRAGCPHLRSL